MTTANGTSTTQRSRAVTVFDFALVPTTLISMNFAVFGLFRVFEYDIPIAPAVACAVLAIAAFFLGFQMPMAPHLSEESRLHKLVCGHRTGLAMRATLVLIAVVSPLFVWTEVQSHEAQREAQLDASCQRLVEKVTAAESVGEILLAERLHAKQGCPDKPMIDALRSRLQ